MRALKFITGHVIYNPAHTYKFQLKTTFELVFLLLRLWHQVSLLQKMIGNNLDRNLVVYNKTQNSKGPNLCLIFLSQS
jgi:hypothetical protein